MGQVAEREQEETEKTENKKCGFGSVSSVFSCSVFLFEELQNANGKMQIANWAHLRFLERNHSLSACFYPIRQSGHTPGRFAAFGSGGCRLLPGDSGSAWPLAIVSS